MRESLKTGFNFGLTSGIITTLGLIVGLEAGTHSTPIVIGGILTIAIADAFSDSLGIHICEESENKHTTREVWESTISTFMFKFLFALTFIIPILLLDLNSAIIASVVWGLTIISILSFTMARKQKKPFLNVVGEHVVIALVVITITHYVGDWIAVTFI